MTSNNKEINDKLLSKPDAKVEDRLDAKPTHSVDTTKVDEEDKAPLESSKNDGHEDDFEITMKEREKRTLQRFSTKATGKPVREVRVGEDRTPEQAQVRKSFLGNAISTAKYTLLSFFPLNLFEQVSKLANTYFLLLSILQCIPAISITDGRPTMLLPLSVVILVSMVKDFVEDRKRQNSDTAENHSKVLLFDYRSAIFDEKRWSDLHVGDIVKILRDTPFPADLVLLNSSAQKGICYIETKNLDGETNLKHKIAKKETLELAHDEAALGKLEGSIMCEVPNPALYSFEGALKVGDDVIPLSAEQLLLRGSSLKNTDYIYGAVVYTGAESKIQMNSSRARSKRSIIENLTHKQILLIFLIQLGISMGCALGGLLWLSSHHRTASYLEVDTTRTGDKMWYVTLKLFSSWLLMTV